MKKSVLLLPILLLFFACPVEEEDPRPYDGIWITDSFLGQITLTLDKGDWTQDTSSIDAKGTVTDVDSDTITFKTTHIGADGMWAETSDAEDTTWDWVLSADGNTLTMSDPNNIVSDNVYTKQ